MDKGLKYVGTNTIRGMALGSQEGHKLYLGGTLIWEDPIIEFDDPAVKAICVANWGNRKVQDEITVSEAAAVTSLGGVFKGNTDITSFNELRFFTGLTSLYSSGSSTSTKGQFDGCSNLKEIEIPSNCIELRGAIRGTAIEEIDLSALQGKSGSSAANLAAFALSLTTLEKAIFPTMECSTFSRAFRGCTGLADIVINGTLNLSECANFTETFYNCSSLTNISGSITGIRQALDLRYSPNLTLGSLRVIINGLADLTGSTGKTLTLHATAKARLTAEDMAIAQNKNWQIA